MRNQPFFITGLPRSRTAWMAVAATTADSVCKHEPTMHYASFEALLEWWAADVHVLRGVSDSGLGMMLPEILNALGCRTLVVERPLEDVERSIYQLWDEHGVVGNQLLVRRRLNALDEVLARHRRHRLVKVVDFDDLCSPHVVAEALDWIMPMVAAPNLRELVRMNIQADLRYSLAHAYGSSQWWMPEALRGVA